MTEFMKNYQATVRAALPVEQKEIIRAEHEKVYATGKFGDFTDLSPQGQAMLMKIIDAAPENERRSIIDYGCGTGKLLNILDDRYKFWFCVGLDFSETLIDLGRSLRPKNILLINLDFHNCDYDWERFNIGLSVHSLEHCVDPEKAVKAMMHYVQRLIIVTPTYGIADTCGIVEGPSGQLAGDLHLHDLSTPAKLQPFIDEYETVGCVTGDKELFTIIRRK